MAKMLGLDLPADLQRRLRGDDLEAVADKVVLVSTVDAEGWPHAAMLSYFEVVAIDPRTIRIAAYGSSSTVANMRHTGKVTLIVIDERVAYYVKAEVEELAAAMTATPFNAALECRVRAVLADEPDEVLEPGAYVASGVTYVNPKRAAEIVRARLVLQELREAGPGSAEGGGRVE